MHFYSFVNIQEFPFIRYRAAMSCDVTTEITFRDLIPTKLAAGVWNCLVNYKKRISGYPQNETCELLILDRSIDQVFIWCCALAIFLVVPAYLVSMINYVIFVFLLVFLDCTCYSWMVLWCHLSWPTKCGRKQICAWGTLIYPFNLPLNNFLVYNSTISG